MGKRGPAPTPTALRLVKGDRKDRINKSEVKPPTDEVTAPTWLSVDARAVWDRLAPSQVTRGTLTVWDVDAFAVFCDAVVQYRAASDLVAKSGILLKGRTGVEVVKNPALQIVRDSAQTIRAFAQEFGLTPSSRSTISMPGDIAPPHPADAYLT